MKAVSISITKKLSKRMNKFIIYESDQIYRLTISLSPPHYHFYKNIERGKRSHVFNTLINEYLDVLEKEKIKKTFGSKSELIRNALIYVQLSKNEDNMYVCLKPPNIDPPLGNVFHMNGEWRKYHNDNKILKYDLERQDD